MSPLLFALRPAMTDRTLAIVLAAGFVAVFIALVVMVWTRWGQARPMSKCAGLSFAAHALLLIYAYSTQVLFDQPGSLFGQAVKVYVPDAHDDEEAAPHPEIGEPQAWDQPGIDNAPELNALAPSPARPDFRPREIERMAPALPTPAIAPPRIAPLPMAGALSPPPNYDPLPFPEPRPAQGPAPAQALDPGDLAASGLMPAAEPGDLTNLLPDQPAPGAPSPNQADVAAKSPPASEQSGQTTPLPPPDAGAPEAGTGQASSSTQATVPRRLGDGQEVAEPLRARVVADRLKVAQQFGATPQTESAVAEALAWLAANQAADGRWDAAAHGAGRETRTLDIDRQGAGA
ncbi:MAG: hypothetical protein L0211_06505, partial [Planctomycetaceae bacterium]|nr:hypothetical protein [Planctomycetaceae bacterium]